MKILKVLGVVGIALLAGCDTPVDPALVSAAPAAPQQFSAAKAAAAICGRNAPNWSAAEAQLVAAGYRETTSDWLPSVLPSTAAQKAGQITILEKPGTDVVVQFGTRAGEGACLVGLKNMTPQQSYALALPWAQQFDAETNAERGNGLAKNAVQAWFASDDDGNTYIAAMKTWPLLDGPGAVARLMYYRKR
ncbi:hypothetical protein AB0T83_14230 [Fluviibacterium sp. DFM31]|uniref:Lipoprotein n=1 Tax=Meridianimarinicoccus marinus TaxID=3231483 RepID=A0ABV3L8U3_9RHOB